MHKLETHLTYFRFNNIFQHRQFYINWYILQSGNNNDDCGRCFNYNELNQFQNFVNGSPLNFQGVKNYSNCEEGDGPYCGGLNALVRRQKLTFPNNIILRKEPRINNLGNIFACMDIILLDQNNIDKPYNLDFDVIGRIILQ